MAVDGADPDNSAGDAAGGALWAVALYYCSPLQLLLLFLGRFEVERPSDGVLRLLGRTAGLRCARLSRMMRMVTMLMEQRAAMLWSTHAPSGTWCRMESVQPCMAFSYPASSRKHYTSSRLPCMQTCTL